MKNVTYKEMMDFVNQYPSKLVVDVCGIGEPPVKSWNDFTLGNWPASIVARCCIFDNDPYYTDIEEDYVNHGEFCTSSHMIIGECNE